MYSSEYENQVETTEQNGSFYQNNKVLVWIFIAIVLIAIIIFFVKKSSNSTPKPSGYTITIYPDNPQAVVALGGEYELLAVINPNVNAELVWTSSDENIAKFSNGKVMGINYGKAVITASYTDVSNNKTYTATKDVVVADGNPNITLTDVSFPDGDLLMPTNGTYGITLVTTPNNGYITNKQFTSSNESVVKVDNKGLVQAVGEGEAVITLTVNDGAFRKDLNVIVNKNYTSAEIAVNATKITLNTEVKTIKLGASAKLSYVITPSNTDSTRLTWTSSDESVITVDKNGIIQALKEGKATIKVSATSTVYDSIEITVEPAGGAITEISLSIADLYLEVGQSQNITPSISPSTVTDKTLTFTVDDPTIVSINPASGESTTVKGLKEGMATLTIKASDTVTKTLTITVGSTVNIDPGDSGGGSSGGGGSSSCKKTCPAGQYVKNCKCVKCDAGYYCQSGKRTKCPSYTTSKEGASSCTRTGCPAGSYLDSSYSTGCRPCPSGKYCSGNKAMPQTCANGKIPNSKKSGCDDCKITNCVSYGGGGTSCTCTKCQPNYVSQGTSCKYVGGSTQKPCASRGTVGECNASSSCKWDYTYGCRNK